MINRVREIPPTSVREKSKLIIEQRLRDCYGDFTIPDLTDLYKQIWDPDAQTGRLGEVKPTAGPGIPYNILGKTNRDILYTHGGLVASHCLHFLENLVNRDLEAEGVTLEDLNADMLLSYSRLFVKDEPHKVTKEINRIIVSSPLHMQVAERILFSAFFKKVVAKYSPGSITSVGIGFTDEMGKKFHDYISKGGTKRTDDMPGWDYSVTGELDEDYREIIDSMINSSPDGHLPSRERCRRLWKNICYLRQFKLYVTSDGRVRLCNFPGITESGRFDTGFGNSVKRVTLHVQVVLAMGLDHDGKDLFAMGDDCCYDYIPNLDLQYAKFGFNPKAIRIFEEPSKEFEFCSHGFNSGVVTLKTWGKTLFRLLGHRFDPSRFGQFEYEIRHNPERLFILDFLEKLGYFPEEPKEPHATPPFHLLCGPPEQNLIMPKKKANGKSSVAKRADNGQNNNKRAIANDKRLLHTVADRTISNQTVASEVNKFVRHVHNEQPMRTVHAVPSNILTDDEVRYHNWISGAPGHSPILPNYNVEPSLYTQPFTSRFMWTQNVPNGDCVTIVVAPNLSTAADNGGAAGVTPKAFYTPKILNAGSVGGIGIPGPCGNTVGNVQACVLVGTRTGGSDDVIVDTTASQSPAGYMDVKQSKPVCPFTSVDNQGTQCRWQCGRIRIRTINETRGDQRGGLATLMQPQNSLEDVIPTTATYLDEFIARGFYRSYPDLNVCSKHSDGAWVSLDVRPGQMAFHTAMSSTSTYLHGASTFLQLSNPTNSAQTVKVFIEIDWEISGAVVRGISKPKVVSAQASDHARETSEAMRAAGVLPSDQKPKESVAAALKLKDDRALQLMHGLDTGKKVVDAVSKLAGSSTSGLAAAGRLGAAVAGFAA